MHHFRTLKELESQSSDQQQAADEASSTAEAAEQTRRQEQAAAEARRHAAAQEQAHSRERTRRQERAAAEARKHAAAQEQAHSREQTRRQERAAAEARKHAAAQDQAHSRERTRRQERAAAEARKHAAAQEQAHSREQTRRQERAAAEARKHAAAQEQAYSREQTRRQERAAEEPRSPVAAAETAPDKPPDKQRIFYLETLDAFELLESQGKLTPEESARLQTMRLTRSDYLDMARRKLSGNPDATDNEIRDLSEWLFYERDPDGYQKYKTGQVLTEARRLYEEAGLQDAQDVEDLRAYNASRAERGYKTLARDVLQGVGSLSDDPDEAHKQVEEWGRYIWSVLSPMGFNRDYHLAQAEHDKLREGLAWQVAMAGDKMVEVETEDGGKGYVLQSELDAPERYERELAAFRQQREPFENLSRLMAQGGDELILTDQGYLPRSAVEAQQQLGTLARLAALSGDELVLTDQGYMPRSTIQDQQQPGDLTRLAAQTGDDLVSTPHGLQFRSDMERRATLSRLAAQVDDELVFTDQGYLPRSIIEEQEQAQRRLGDLARLMAQGGDDLVLTDQGYLPRSAVEAQQQLGDLARLAALSGDELVPIEEQQEQLVTQARLAAQAGDELVLLPDGFGILQSDLEALPDDLQQQAREHGYFMLKPVEDLTDEEIDKRLAVTYPGMDVSELPDNAYVLPTGPPGAALAGALEPLPDDATERERKTRALLVPEAEQEAKEGLQRAAISFIPILSTAMHWNDMSTRWKALSVAGDAALFVPWGRIGAIAAAARGSRIGAVAARGIRSVRSVRPIPKIGKPVYALERLRPLPQRISPSPQRPLPKTITISPEPPAPVLPPEVGVAG